MGVSHVSLVDRGDITQWLKGVVDTIEAIAGEVIPLLNDTVATEERPAKRARTEAVEQVEESKTPTTVTTAVEEASTTAPANFPEYNLPFSQDLDLTTDGRRTKEPRDFSDASMTAKPSYLADSEKVCFTCFLY